MVSTEARVRVLTPPGAQPLRTGMAIRWYLAMALAALNVGDLLLTKAVLAAGGRELNPLMEPIIHHPIAPTLVKVGVPLLIMGLLLLCPPKSKVVDRSLAVAVVLYAGVVAYNAALLLTHNATF